LSHKTITFEGRSYYFDPNCNCGGCEGLRHYPDPSLCDWCNQTHCGDSQHCVPPDTDAASGDGVYKEDSTFNDSDDAWLEVLCQNVRDRIRQTTNYVKELYGMPLPPPVERQERSNTSQQTGGGSNGRRGGQNQQSGHPYLKNDNLSTVRQRVRVLAVQLQDSKYNPGQKKVVFKIALTGKIFLWPLELDNLCYKAIHGMFGADENDYVDKQFDIYLEENEFSGRMWPTVAEVSEETKPSRKSR
jgi:hypothetical protein